MTAHGFTAGPISHEFVGDSRFPRPHSDDLMLLDARGSALGVLWTDGPNDLDADRLARLIAAAPRYHAAAEEMLRVAEVGVVNDLEAFGRAIRLLREAHAAANGSRG